MTQILLIMIIVEAILLLLLGVLKKLTKQIFIGIAVITAIVAGVFFARMRSVDKAQKSYDEKECLYMAAKLLEQSHSRESLEALTMVEDENTAEYGVRSLRGLAYNMNNAHMLCLEYLEDPADENEKAVYEASVKSANVEESLKTQITDNTIRLLAFDEDRMNTLDDELKVRFLSNKKEIPEAPAADDYIYEARSAMINGDFSQAFERVKTEADRGNADADIVLSQLYDSGYNNEILGEDDPEYDQLLRELTVNEVAMQRYQLQNGVESNTANTAGQSSTDQNPEEQAARLEQTILSGKYNLARSAIYMERGKRAINYLEFNKPENSESNIAYNLQMAHLYYGINDYEQAKQYLDKIFGEKEMDTGQTLGAEAYLLREAYVIGKEEEDSQSFNSLYDQLMSSLYQNIIPGYTDYGFRNYLEDYFHDLLGGIQIQSLDDSEFPVIQAKVHTISDELELSEAANIFKDSGDDVKDLTIEKQEISKLYICYVLDVSGSMQGDRIENAKSAINQSIMNVSDDTEIALVSFESNAMIRSGLTTSKSRVIGVLNGLVASGGTNIASGISMAADVLAGVEGTKVIILLSDGQDGNASMLPAALDKVAAEDINVHTIGLTGSDKEYLSHISESSSGSFVSVDNSYELAKIYDEIQNYMQTSYRVTYKVSDETDQMRYLDIRSSGKEPTHERIWYSTVEEETDMVDYSKIEQSAEYFKQTGGTK